MAFKVWQCVELLKSWKFPPPKRPKAFILRASSAASHLFDCLIARGKRYGQKLTKTLLILQPDWSFSLRSRLVFGTMLSVQNHLAWNGTWQRPVCSAWHSCSQGSQTMSWLSKLPDIVQKTSDTAGKRAMIKQASRDFSLFLLKESKLHFCDQLEKLETKPVITATLFPRCLFPDAVWPAQHTGDEQRLKLDTSASICGIKWPEASFVSQSTTLIGKIKKNQFPALNPNTAVCTAGILSKMITGSFAITT